jgi:hypothetical protein
MSRDLTLAVALRVLRQLHRDRRSIAMVLIAPLFLLWVLKLTFEDVPGVFNRIGPMLLGTFPFTTMFLVTSITMLRERNQGTLDRNMVSPIGRGDSPRRNARWRWAFPAGCWTCRSTGASGRSC